MLSELLLTDREWERATAEFARQREAYTPLSVGLRSWGRAAPTG